MNRRGFLGMFGAAIAGASLDPERALWVPGGKLISIPAYSPRLILSRFDERFELVTLQTMADVLKYGGDRPRGYSSFPSVTTPAKRIHVRKD